MTGAVIAYAVLGNPGGLDRASHPLPQSVYIWQRVWSDEVPDAIRHFTPHVDQYMILAAESHLTDEHISWVLPDLDWSPLTKSEIPTTLVFRMGSEITLLLRNGDTDALVSDLYEIWPSLAMQATEAGVILEGLQLDYDSPSGDLERYKDLLVALREQTPEARFSITTLPTWMTADSFEPLVSTCDYFVLQVHSLEKPEHIDDVPDLTSAIALPGYLKTASQTGVPFTVALPTYSYELIFDNAGTFTGIVAEQKRPELRGGEQIRTVRADPAALRLFANELRTHPPAGCIGITWFRMPVESDRLNWSRDTMTAMLRGQMPDLDPQINVIEVRDDLYEIHVQRGARATEDGLTLTLERSYDIVFVDVMGDFALERKPQHYRFNGRPPRDNAPVPVGWVRVKAGSAPPAPHLERTVQ